MTKLRNRTVPPALVEGLMQLGRIGARAGAAFVESVLHDLEDQAVEVAQKTRTARERVTKYPRERERTRE